MATNLSQTPAKHHPLALRLECRREFIEGLGSLGEIAAKHGISTHTIRDWCLNGGWSEARNRWKDRQLDDPQPPSQAPVGMPVLPSNDAGNGHAQESIVRLERQLTTLDDQLEAARTPDGWHKLSTARQKLFEQWRILRGIPLPGSRRPPKERTRPAPTGTVVPE